MFNGTRRKDTRALIGAFILGLVVNLVTLGNHLVIGSVLFVLVMMWVGMSDWVEQWWSHRSIRQEHALLVRLKGERSRLERMHTNQQALIIECTRMVLTSIVIATYFLMVYLCVLVVRPVDTTMVNRFITPIISGLGLVGALIILLRPLGQELRHVLALEQYAPPLEKRIQALEQRFSNTTDSETQPPSS